MAYASVRIARVGRPRIYADRRGYLCGGLDGGDGYWLWFLGVFWCSEIVENVAQEGGATGDFVFVILGGGGEEALFGVGGDLFDLGWQGVVGAVAGQVGAGDLEAVKEEAGAAGVEGVGGDGEQDLADGLLDGGAVFGQGEVEGVVLVSGVGDGAAGGVVVVAEVFVA